MCSLEFQLDQLSNSLSNEWFFGLCQQKSEKQNTLSWTVLHPAAPLWQNISTLPQLLFQIEGLQLRNAMNQWAMMQVCGSAYASQHLMIYEAAMVTITPFCTPESVAKDSNCWCQAMDSSHLSKHVSTVRISDCEHSELGDFLMTDISYTKTYNKNGSSTSKRRDRFSTCH